MRHSPRPALPETARTALPKSQFLFLATILCLCSQSPAKNRPILDLRSQTSPWIPSPEASCPMLLPKARLETPRPKAFQALPGLMESWPHHVPLRGPSAPRDSILLYPVIHVYYRLDPCAERNESLFLGIILSEGIPGEYDYRRGDEGPGRTIPLDTLEIPLFFSVYRFNEFPLGRNTPDLAVTLKVRSVNGFDLPEDSLKEVGEERGRRLEPYEEFLARHWRPGQPLRMTLGFRHGERSRERNPHHPYVVVLDLVAKRLERGGDWP